MPVKPNEEKPRPAVPVTYVPLGSRYEVKAGDTWVSIAKSIRLDPWDLIDHNFPGMKRILVLHGRQRASRQVNWYLRKYVGCQVTYDGKNWGFGYHTAVLKGEGAWKGGVIYLPPPDVVVMDPEVITGRKTTNKSPLAVVFGLPGSDLSRLSQVFDALTLLDIGIEIATVASVGIMATAGTILGITAAVTFPIAITVAIASGYEAALNDLRKKEILEGMSLGVVLAADGRSVQWIRTHGFVKYLPVYNAYFPNYGRQLQSFYNTALVAGIGHGQQFNTVATKNLFVYLQGQMPDTAKKLYSGDSRTWSSQKWIDYYRLCAAILRPKLVFN